MLQIYVISAILISCIHCFCLCLGNVTDLFTGAREGNEAARSYLVPSVPGNDSSSSSSSERFMLLEATASAAHYDFLPLYTAAIGSCQRSNVDLLNQFSLGKLSGNSKKGEQLLHLGKRDC